MQNIWTEVSRIFVVLLDEADVFITPEDVVFFSDLKYEEAWKAYKQKVAYLRRF